MNGANEVQDINTADFKEICDYFNTRLSTYVPTGHSAQGALNNNSYAQLLYTAFYNACLFYPITKTGESLFSGYAKGNWYVPSIEEIRILVAHRIISTTTTTNENQSASDWDSSAYNGKGIFKSGNSSHFNGFLE